MCTKCMYVRSAKSYIVGKVENAVVPTVIIMLNMKKSQFSSLEKTNLWNFLLCKFFINF